MTTLLIDGPNILARSDFAAKGKQVEMSAGGVNTAALVLFINMLSRYVRQVEPDRLLVCWDAGHAFRDEAYPGYKAARKKADPDSPDTIPFALAKEFLTWAGVPHRAHTGYEADDLIAVAARQIDGAVVILSGDKDLLQLVDDGSQSGVRVTQIRVPDDTEWNESRVEAKFGVFPEHLPYYLALVGDPGDGVPGLKGIGPKRACALLEKAEWDWEALMDLLGPEEAQQAALMRSLVDLRHYPYDEVFMAGHARVPEFRPTSQDDPAWPMLEKFCDRLALFSVRERLVAGTLWAAPSPVGPDLFTEILE